MLTSEWQSSSACGATSCVQVRQADDGMIEVRKWPDPDAGTLRFTHAEWDAFVGGAREGEFDAL